MSSDKQSLRTKEQSSARGSEQEPESQSLLGKRSDLASQSNKSKKQGPAETSMFVMTLVIISYMITSQVLTLVNKYLYAKYHFQSPLNLLFMQCLCNILICCSLMAWKSFVNPNAYSGMASYGIAISSFGEATSGTKFQLGFAIGIMNMVQVLFGLYAAKFCNIPLLLTNRRCAILATIIVQLILLGMYPDGKLMFSTTLIVLGAIIAGYDSLDANAVGFVFVWLTNFTQGIQNVFTAKYNNQKQVAAFEINFYFACIGLPIMLFLTLQKGDFWNLYDIFTTATPDYGLQSMLLVSGGFGFVITMNVLLVVTLVGPLALNVAGTSKDIILTFVGIAIFQDQKLSAPFLVGLAFSFGGASIFTYNKIAAKQEADKKKAEEEAAKAAALENENVKESKLKALES